MMLLHRSPDYGAPSELDFEIWGSVHTANWNRNVKVLDSVQSGGRAGTRTPDLADVNRAL